MMSNVFHVTTLKRLKRTKQRATLNEPGDRVNAWNCIEEAERFATSTGRRIIVRLTKERYTWQPMDGHGEHGIYTMDPVPYQDIRE